MVSKQDSTENVYEYIQRQFSYNCFMFEYWDKISVHKETDITLTFIFNECWIYPFQGPQHDSYKYAVTPGDEGDKKGKKKGQKKDMEELKQELTMDEHKVPITELYSKLNTDPTTVSEKLQIRVCYW